MAPAIGIDLGTTYSCVSVFKKGKVEIIANSQGSRILPSYVAFTDTERLVGDPAKRQAAINPQNTIFDAKRLIGRRFDDLQVQEDMKHWPFGVINVEGKPMLQATFKGELKTFSPEEISSMILMKMKETAEAFLDMEVQDAVITVPAYFNDSQRQATKDAGTIAGLNILRIINEPTAAALAYGLQKEVKGERNVLIYDLGGGTFDVTVMTITDGSEFIVKSTHGDSHLGGEDFDSRIVQFLVEKFEELHNKDISGDPRAMRRLRIAAEDAKLNLSSSASSSIRVDSLFDGIDFCTELSRQMFDELCMDLFKKTLQHVQETLSNAEMDQDAIHDVVLVGGSTRIPKVQELLREFFSGKELNFSINPDEAVAYGAAVQAAILSQDSSVFKGIVLVDVTPLSLGVETYGGLMSNVIERNTQVPCKQSKMFTTVKENQTSIDIIVFEGERKLTKDNNFLGNFVLFGVPPKPAGTPKFDVTFDIDENSILKVSVVERSTGASEKVTIRSGKSNLSAAEIDRLRCEAERYKAEDKRQLERITSRNSFELYVHKLQTRIFSNSGSQIDDFNKNRLIVLCDEALTWLEANPEAGREEYEEKMKELQLEEE